MGGVWGRLYHGNLVVDTPVPSKLLDMCALKNDREFTHMRYTAATCDPNDFLVGTFSSVYAYRLLTRSIGRKLYTSSTAARPTAQNRIIYSYDHVQRRRGVVHADYAWCYA